MKKIILGFLLLALIVSGIFYKSLLETYSFYKFQSDNPEVVYLGTVNWNTMSFTSTSNNAAVYDPLTMENLTVPVTFAGDYSKGDSYVHVEKKKVSITLFTPEEMDFFSEYEGEFTKEEERAICKLLERTSDTRACETSQKFYEAYLKLNDSDVGLFSSSKDKGAYLKLMILKSLSLPSRKISQFETEHFAGFLYHINEDNFSVHLFPNENIMYPVNFNDLSEADVSFILSNSTFAR